MKKNITLTLPVEVWDTIVSCVPQAKLLAVEPMQHVIQFLSQYNEATKQAKSYLKPVVYEDDPDS